MAGPAPSPPDLSAAPEDASLADWPATRAHLFVAASLLVLFVWRLGSYGLWDPWESHYAEVAREILDRGDGIRLHWRTEWFWSKPVLSFWLMALSMRLFGINRGGPAELVESSLPEWAARLPFALVSAAGLFALYLAFSRRLGRRTAAMGTLAAATASQVLFIARQAITDMLFVGLMAMAIAAYQASLDVDDEEPAPRYRIGSWTIGLNHLTVAAVLLATVPQLLLIGLTLYRPVGINLVAPTIAGGWAVVAPFAILVTAFAMPVARFVYRARDCWLFLAYTAGGVAVLAKGIPGLGLPLLILVVYGAISGELRRELKPRTLLVHAIGLGLVALPIAVPWFVAMHISFPRGFVNEFFGQHHWQRLAKGVHGETGGWRYYVPWLSYGLFPWTGLAAAGLLSLRPAGWNAPLTAEARAERARLLLGVWGVACFIVFTVTKTKFHHYILPATLPLAFLAGVALDGIVRGRIHPLLVAGALAVYGYVAVDLTQLPQRLIWLFVYNYKRPFPTDLDYRGTLSALAVIGAIPLAALLTASAAKLSPRIRLVAAQAMLAGAFGWALFCAQKYQVEVAQHWTCKELVARYFKERKNDSDGKPERLVAWQMNWRGETFYTKSSEVPYVSLNNAGVNAWFDRHAARLPGSRVFVIFEKGRLANLKKNVLRRTANGQIELLTGPENNKFFLGVVTVNPAAPEPPKKPKPAPPPPVEFGPQPLPPDATPAPSSSQGAP